MLAAHSMPTADPRPPASTADRGAAWAAMVAPVAPFLAEVRQYLDAQVSTFEPEVAEGAAYAISASGKQLRPVLVGLSARAAGPLSPHHVTGAAIVELVHLATLVHDDIIDAAEVRRQQPTVAARFGNRTAVLLGDCLFAHALDLASSYPTPEVCRVVAAATRAVCSGEILQTLRQDRIDQSLDHYFRVIRLKTAELFALACELGALLAEASPTRRAALRQFGIAFGTAYQVYDDCLDFFGNEESAGKTLGTDLLNGKVTLPLLLTYRDATPADRLRLQQALDQPNAHSTVQVRELLDRYQAGPQAQRTVNGLLEEARTALRPCDRSLGAADLLQLTQFLEVQVGLLTLG